jgi:hypothetical protein
MNHSQGCSFFREVFIDILRTWIDGINEELELNAEFEVDILVTRSGHVR